MKRLLTLVVALVLPSFALARQAMTPAPLNIRTTDGTVSNYPYQLKVPNSSLTDNADGTMTFSAIISTNVSQAQTINITSGTITTFYASTGTITNLVGTTTNDNAAAGNYGQYVSTQATSVTWPTASGTYGDVGSLTLAAGDYEISIIINCNPGTTVGGIITGVSTTSGNNGTGLTLGDNAAGLNVGGTAVVGNTTIAVPGYRISIAGSTQYFFKLNVVYASSVTITGRMSARRMR